MVGIHSRAVGVIHSGNGWGLCELSEIGRPKSVIRNSSVREVLGWCGGSIRSFARVKRSGDIGTLSMVNFVAPPPATSVEASAIAADRAPANRQEILTLPTLAQQAGPSSCREEYQPRRLQRIAAGSAITRLLKCRASCTRRRARTSGQPTGWSPRPRQDRDGRRRGVRAPRRDRKSVHGR